MQGTTVIDLINSSEKPLFTFELLPPLKGHSIERIYHTIENLLEYSPAYINFTSHRNEVVLAERPDGLLEKRVTRKRPGTIALAAAVKYKYNVNVVPHLLCGGFTREETENVLIEMNFLGINDVLALRGDPPRGSRVFIPEPDGHRNSSELVRQIADMNKGHYIDPELKNMNATSFCIGVAAYPEKHFEAPNMKNDMMNLKLKVEAGASYVVTQMFFDNAKFYAFRNAIRAMGINVPLIPGIKPVTAMTDVNLLPQTFHIEMPEELVHELSKCRSDEEAREVGIEWATVQSRDLLKNEVPGIHYYTLGRSDNIARIVKASY
jgi:methylenetetrahydrofolate reductase (NADPH)